MLQIEENLPQLFMRASDLSALPPIFLPHGVSLHNHAEGMEESWERLIEKSFGKFHSFEQFILNGGGYKPEYVLYLSKDGKEIATTTAVEIEKVPGEGWFRMVAVDPEARGVGAGKLIALAAMHSLAARGYKSIVLSTDDFRLPAINMYYKLGFRPIMTHESHPKRWEEVLAKLGKNN